MHRENVTYWKHGNAFGQDRKTAGESRTIWVIILTATMMVVEIGAGLVYGFIVLLTDKN